MTRTAATCVLLLAVACGGSSSPTAPSPVTPSPSPTPAPTPTPTPTPAPTPTRVTVFGVATNADTGAPASGLGVSAWQGSATVAPSTTTDGNGYYSLAGVPTGPTQIVFMGPGFNQHTERVTVERDMRVDVRLVPMWSRSGVGDTVFDMPTYVSRVHIRGHYPSSSSNFIVRIGGRLVVNELLGYSWRGPTFEGTYTTRGGVVEITHSRDVQWTFTQVQ